MCIAFYTRIPGRRTGVALALLAWLVSACAESTPKPAALPATESAAPGPSAIPKGALGRQAVVAEVDAGLGHFLRRIRVEPSLEGAQFSGFRIVELLTPEFWQDVDLQPGDVVTHVNGQSIEDPNVAYEVFESLRQAPALEVHLLRAGQSRQLSFPIVGAPRPAPERPQPAGG